MLANLEQGAYQRLADWHKELTAFRRDLHAHPELGFEEVRTAGRIEQALKLAGCDEVHTGIGKTGVVAVVRGQGDGDKAIGLRADMDALPMREENDVPWRSTSAHLMHGCGHDGHMAMLVGAAKYLAQTRRFSGNAVLIFQPGEEGCAGAKAMIEDGLFDRFPVDAVYAMHNWPSLPAGTVGVNAGPMMAAADRVEIIINGKGGHGAHPYMAVDPVLVAAHIITAAQSLVSRNVNPLDSAVLSLCAVQSGDLGAFSVIPRQAQLIGTVRTFKREVQDMIEERLGRLVESVAMGFGATAVLNYQRMYPATVNSPAEAKFCCRRGGRGGGAGARDTRSGAQHGRRGLCLHAAGQAGGLPAHRPGRRKQLLPAQQPLRLQRRDPAAGGCIAGVAGRERNAAAGLMALCSFAGC